MAGPERSSSWRCCCATKSALSLPRSSNHSVRTQRGTLDEHDTYSHRESRSFTGRQRLSSGVAQLVNGLPMCVSLQSCYRRRASTLQTLTSAALCFLRFLAFCFCFACFFFSFSIRISSCSECLRRRGRRGRAELTAVRMNTPGPADGIGRPRCGRGAGAGFGFYKNPQN